MSKSVADLFKAFRDMQEDNLVSIYKDTTETERFCRYFNKFFDCLNTRSLYEGMHKRNDNLNPYTDVDDERLQVRLY